MKRLCMVLTLLLAPLMAGAYEQPIDFDVLKKNYLEGKYDHILSENEFLAHSWLEKGDFDEYIYNRKDSIKLAMQKYSLARSAQKKNSSRLARIQKNKNRMLCNICEYHPDLHISRVVKNILEYDKLTEKHQDALEYMTFLEFGVIDISSDPAARQIQEMMFDFTLRSLVASSLLFDGKIGPTTDHIYQAVLEMDKEKHLRALCERHPDSYAAQKCIEAMDVTAAMIPVAYDKKYLSDLLVAMRAPENEVEEKVCRILKDAYSKRMELLGNR